MDLDQLVKKFEEMGYRFHGTGAVEICHWTRKAIKNQGTCYKNTFYGIPTHRCMEFSPSALFCQNSCIYCWRPAEFLSIKDIDKVEWTDPEEMVEELIKKRKQLLIGFKGNPDADKKLLEEAFEPVHFAISLSGEPTLYPKLPELVKYLRRRPGTFSIFIVTNGQEPEMLERLQREDALPTQLYLSLTAPTEELYKKISVPSYKDGWERLMRSLDFLSRAKTRTVLRITLIKGYNMVMPEKWAELIERSNAHFVEFKAFMLIGHSRYRLRASNQPSFEEVAEFAEEVMKHTKKYEFMDEHVPSKIVVYKNKERKVDRFIKGPLPKDNLPEEAVE